jgi:glycosyltransferase involved in cell wall biosynthesis
MANNHNNEPEISVILPCQNEEQALPFCLNQIKETIKKNNLSAEVIVSDSSTDQSPEIAKKENVVLIKHDKDGYGLAYLEAFKIARGKYIFMADADGTYDFGEIPNFINYLKDGYDFVLGNRFAGKIEKGAMPLRNKYLGNPFLSGILRIFFNTKIKDSHCGMRAITKKALQKLNLQTAGMEFASETIIKALKNNLKIKEIPINYYQRKGLSKLRPFSDAWKHLRFMLLYSPLFLFFIPGLILFLAGFILMAWFLLLNPKVIEAGVFFRPMFLSALSIIIGYQLILFSVFAKTYSIVHLKEQSPIMEKLYKYITIEKASVVGAIIALLGIVVFILIKQPNAEFNQLIEVKNSITALTLIAIGAQTIFSSFMLSILGIKEK